MVRKFKIGNGNAHPIVVMLFDTMSEQEMKLATMAAMSGNSINALTDWRYRTTPNIANLDASLNVVGMKLIAVPLDFDEETIQKTKPNR